MSDPLDKFKDVDLEKLMFDDLVRQIREDHNERLSHIIIHPEVYKVIEDYNNQNALQKFLQKLKWGFKDCLNNFRNWQGHMRGEDWDFWEILNGEWSDYE
jgi:hypothetical protein